MNAVKLIMKEPLTKCPESVDHYTSQCEVVSVQSRFGYVRAPDPEHLS
jgi:hypothetical protein